MDFRRRSAPQQRSSPPLPPSWKRSDVAHAVDMLDDVRATLHRAQLVEGIRPTGTLLREARDGVDVALEAAHGLLRMLGHDGTR